MDDDVRDRGIAELLAATVEDLRHARGDSERIKTAIATYLSKGETFEMGPFELRDYYDISTPGLPELAGFTSDEMAIASELFDEVSRARYKRDA